MRRGAAFPRSPEKRHSCWGPGSGGGGRAPPSGLGDGRYEGQRGDPNSVPPLEGKTGEWIGASHRLGHDEFEARTTKPLGTGEPGQALLSTCGKRGGKGQEAVGIDHGGDEAAVRGPKAAGRTEGKHGDHLSRSAVTAFRSGVG